MCADCETPCIDKRLTDALVNNEILTREVEVLRAKMEEIKAFIERESDDGR